MARDLLIVGVNHRTAPVALRERLGVPDAALPRGARRAEGACRRCTRRRSSRPATASRSSPASASRQRSSRPPSRRSSRARAAIERTAFAPHLYVHHGRDAIRHLFRVAASLDSMVVGEPQILGQMKEQYVDGGRWPAPRARCCTRPSTARSRSPSASAPRPASPSKAVSVASVAADLTRTIFETLDDKTVMLIGAGKMSELVARHLKARGSGAHHGRRRAPSITRSSWRASSAASPVPFERLGEYLKHADIVIGSAGAADHLLGPSVVQEVLRARKQRPMFFIDLARAAQLRSRDQRPRQRLPLRHGRPRADERRSTPASASARRCAPRRSSRARPIASWRWLGGLEVVPTIVALRDKIEAIRRGRAREGARLAAGSGAAPSRAPRRAHLVDRQQDPARAARVAEARERGRRRRPGRERRGGSSTSSSATIRAARPGGRRVSAAAEARPRRSASGPAAARSRSGSPSIVAAAIERRGTPVELVTIRTSGDVATGSLAALGGKGLFVKEIEEALLPASDRSRGALVEGHAGHVAARARRWWRRRARADPRDVLISAAGTAIADLPGGHARRHLEPAPPRAAARAPVRRRASSTCAATSIRGSASSRAARSTRSCSRRPGSRGSGSRRRASVALAPEGLRARDRSGHPRRSRRAPTTPRVHAIVRGARRSGDARGGDRGAARSSPRSAAIATRRSRRTRSSTATAGDARARRRARRPRDRRRRVSRAGRAGGARSARRIAAASPVARRGRAHRARASAGYA